MLPYELKQAIATLQNHLDAQEKVALPLFARKLQKVAENCPEDITIGKMNGIVDQMNRNDQLFITRAEIKDLYRRLYTSGSKFREIFASELGFEKEAEAIAPSATESEFVPFDIYSANDKAFTAELTSALDPNAKSYSPEAGREAENLAFQAVSHPGLAVSSVKASAGNSDTIKVSATFETPHGRATLVVPVSMNGNRGESPSYFEGKDGTHFLSKKSLASYVRGYFVKASSFSESPLELSEERNEAEIASVSEQFETPRGQAQLFHGELASQAAKMVDIALRRWGARAAQVKVIEATDKSITFGVAGGGVAFKVPVRIEGGRVSEPSVILSQGSVQEFSREGIQTIQRENLVDSGVAASVSPLFETNSSALIDIVRDSAEAGNYVRAEEALNVIEQSGDDKAYRTAFAAYSDAMSGVKKTASVQHKCTRIVRNANSTQPICGHLNLPLSKVAQDSQGQCVPQHRKEMMETNAGTYFMDTKVFL